MNPFASIIEYSLHVFRQLALFLALMLFLVAVPAHAQSGWQWSAGPTFSLVTYDLHGGRPETIAAGEGLQISLTHSVLQREVAGLRLDLLDGAVLLFGSRVMPTAAPAFGQLSAALGICTLSSALCLVGGAHLLDSAGMPNLSPFVGGNLSFNIELGSPPRARPSTSILPQRSPLPRAFTLYLGIVPITDDIQNAP